MGKTILEEAVADVHALRKAAEENAKNLLVEAMSPKIEKFIKSHLGEADVPNAPQAPAPDQGQNDVEKTSQPDQDDQDSQDDEYENDDTDDTDDDDTDTDDQDDDDGTEIEVDDDDVQEEGDDKDEDDDDDDEMDESVEVTSDDLKKAFSEVLSGGIKKEDISQGKFADPQDPNDGEYGLAHKVEGEVQWADAPRVLKKAKNAKMVTKEQHEKVVRKLYGQLAQYQEAFKYLKKNLNEMNLFNAKLVYTTKLLQNNLSNKQKLTVVEAIDKAGSKQEVELVYSTLSESLKIAGCVNEQRRKSKGPKASRVTKPGSTLTEGKTAKASTTNRWAELAGVLK